MHLRLIREPTHKDATMGSLYINGIWQCWTLEDTIRERVGQPVKAWKVPAQTAIASGRYRVIVTPSPRFNRPLPLLLDVVGFDGVRIHPGNVPADTEGCILVGLDRGDGRVLRSRLAFDLLFPKLEQARGDIWITIENPADPIGQAA